MASMADTRDGDARTGRTEDLPASTGRRAALRALGLGALALRASGSSALGCRGRGEAEAGQKPASAAASAPRPRARDPRAGLEILDWTFPNDPPDIAHRAVVLVPRPLPAGRKLPVLVALHGMGETQTPERGAHGWLDWYALDAGLAALRAPPLTAEDFQGFVTEERLSTVNADLARRAFEGLIVVCPYVPSGIGYAVTFEDWARWLGETLLPRVRRETPALDGARATGIDGVSLGGMTALQIGLSHPELFGAVGALQPAIRGAVGDYVELAAQKLGGRPLRLVTSTEDFFRDAVTDASDRLKSKGIAHDFLLTQGPHDYAWNKGPGAIEMPLWHDRKLRP
jgi:hypothetical protein